MPLGRTDDFRPASFHRNRRETARTRRYARGIHVHGPAGRTNLRMDGASQHSPRSVRRVRTRHGRLRTAPQFSDALDKICKTSLTNLQFCRTFPPRRSDTRINLINLGQPRTPRIWSPTFHAGFLFAQRQASNAASQRGSTVSGVRSTRTLRVDAHQAVPPAPHGLELPMPEVRDQLLRHRFTPPKAL